MIQLEVDQGGNAVVVLRKRTSDLGWKPPRGLRPRIRRWEPSWSAWQRRNSSKMPSPLFEKVRYHPPHSTAYQRYYRHSLASRDER